MTYHICTENMIFFPEILSIFFVEIPLDVPTAIPYQIPPGIPSKIISCHFFSENTLENSQKILRKFSSCFVNHAFEFIQTSSWGLFQTLFR